MYTGHVGGKGVPGGAVAATRLGAAFTCYCCESAAGSCGVRGILIIQGEMKLPATVTREPAVDCSVVDTASARAHEFSWRIDPAKKAAEDAWKPYDTKSYPSTAACNADCERLKRSQRIANRFLGTLRATQQAERQRARTETPCP
jgi:hypothetical protein